VSESPKPDQSELEPAAVKLVNLILASAIQDEARQITLLWRGDDFSMTLQDPGGSTRELPSPPTELWEGIFDRISELTTWTGPRTGLFRVGTEQHVIDCHVLARRRDLSCREFHLILEPSA
jgi:hypothetical protein